MNAIQVILGVLTKVVSAPTILMLAIHVIVKEVDHGRLIPLTPELFLGCLLVVAVISWSSEQTR